MMDKPLRRIDQIPTASAAAAPAFMGRKNDDMGGGIREKSK